MNDSLLVRVVERPSQLPRQLHRLRDQERSLGDALGQRRPLDQLHDEAAYAVRFFQSVDSGNVGMVASTRASRWNRARRSGWFAKLSGRTFSATSRSSLQSRTRYTSTIPPTPRELLTS